MRIRLTQIALRTADKLHPIGAEIEAGVDATDATCQARLDAGTAELLDDQAASEFDALTQSFAAAVGETCRIMGDVVAYIEAAAPEVRVELADRVQMATAVYQEAGEQLADRMLGVLTVGPVQEFDGGAGVSAPESGTSVSAASAGDGSSQEAPASNGPAADDTAGSNDQAPADGDIGSGDDQDDTPGGGGEGDPVLEPPPAGPGTPVAPEPPTGDDPPSGDPELPPPPSGPGTPTAPHPPAPRSRPHHRRAAPATAS